MSILSPVVDRVDGPQRLIFLRSGVRSYHPVDDIYVEVRRLRQLNTDALRSFHNFVKATGNVPAGASFTPRRAVFLRGTRLVPADDTSHTLRVLGQQITDDGQDGPAIIDKSQLTPGVLVDVDYTPAEAEVIVVNGSGSDSQAIAVAVLAQLVNGLSVADRLELITSMVAGNVERIASTTPGVLDDVIVRSDSNDVLRELEVSDDKRRRTVKP